MKVSLHKNGWTVFIQDLDLSVATQQQINTIAKLIATYTLVVIQNQQLSLTDEIRICEMMGNIESNSKFKDYGFDDFVVPGSDYKMTRITGELNENGKPGGFAHVSELGWHADQSANEWRCPIVYLHAIRGTGGSRTSWINNVLSYNDLPAHLKEEYKDIKTINGYKKGAYSEFSIGDKDVNINFNYTPNLIHTNNIGQTGLFFPFLQIHQIVGMSEEESANFVSTLRKHVEQEKYMYHHDWQDGDVAFTEQWLGLHKRWRCESINTRYLHRTSLDYANCDLTDTIDYAC